MSTETKFTPGPWSWEESCDGDVWLSHQYEHDPDTGYIVVIAKEMPDAPDASLIAAAPDLFSLLKEARSTLEMWKDVAPAVSLCADIDKAFAKARGES